MNIDNEFPSKFLKSADLQGEAVKVKIKEVKKEELGNEEKLAIYFVGKSKGMILNKTNAYAIKAVYGPDTDDWVGQTIELFAMPVEFQGRMVEGLRVRVPKKIGAQQQPKAKPAYDDGFAPDDRDRIAHERPGVDPNLDDSVPF